MTATTATAAVASDADSADGDDSDNADDADKGRDVDTSILRTICASTVDLGLTTSPQNKVTSVWLSFIRTKSTMNLSK